MSSQALGFASIAANLGTGVFSTVNAFQQAEFQRDLSSRNQNQIRMETAARAERVDRDRRRRLGLVRARIGATGTTFEGSPLLIAAEEASEAELDRQLVLAGGEARLQRERLRGDIAEGRARNQGIAGAIGTGTSLLTGASAQIRRFGSLI